jgi:hypothetical protein
VDSKKQLIKREETSLAVVEDEDASGVKDVGKVDGPVAVHQVEGDTLVALPWLRLQLQLVSERESERERKIERERERWRSDLEYLHDVPQSPAVDQDNRRDLPECTREKKITKKSNSTATRTFSCLRFSRALTISSVLATGTSLYSTKSLCSNVCSRSSSSSNVRARRTHTHTHTHTHTTHTHTPTHTHTHTVRTAEAHSASTSRPTKMATTPCSKEDQQDASASEAIMRQNHFPARADPALATRTSTHTPAQRA